MGIMHFRSSSSPWGARLLAFAIWALVAGSAVFWALQRPPSAAAEASGVDADAVGTLDPERVALALGAAGNSAPAVASGSLDGKLHLLGVITHGAGGAALVQVGDEPAKPVRVGQAPAGLDGDWVLHAVAPHSVVFAAGDKEIELQMPPMAERSRAGDAVAPERSDANGRSASGRQAPANLNARISRISQRAATRRERADSP